MSTTPVIAANAPSALNELAMVTQGYSPQTAAAAQHSQYLAQALAGMRAEGQNLRTPVALGSDLLAQALLNRKYGQSIQNFATDARGDQQAMAAPATSWLDQQSAGQSAPTLPPIGGGLGGPDVPPGMNPSRATTPGGSPSYAPEGQPGPLQITSSPQGTPTPPPTPQGSPSQPPAAGAAPPSSGGLSGAPASAPPAAASPAAGGASAAGLYHQPVAPEEIALAKQLLSQPRTYQQGIAYVESLRERTAAPVKPEGSVSREGQVISYNPYNPTQPSQATSVPGWRGPLPAGWTYDATGKAVPTAAVQYGAPTTMKGAPGVFQQAPGGKMDRIGDVPYSAPSQTPGIQGVTQTGPDGKVNLVGQSALPADAVLGMRGKFFDSDIYKKFSEARSSLVGFRNAVGQMAGTNNGVLDTAAVDSYMRGINPGASARPTTVQMFMDHLGFPQELQGHVLSLTGNGYMSPQTLQQMDKVMQSYVAAHGSEVQKLQSADATLARTYGADPAALGEDFGEIPQPSKLNFGGAPGPTQAGASMQQTAGTVAGSLGNAAANATGNLPRLSPQQAAALPPGTHFIGLDGKPRVRK